MNRVKVWSNLEKISHDISKAIGDGFIVIANFHNTDNIKKIHFEVKLNSTYFNVGMMHVTSEFKTLVTNLIQSKFKVNEVNFNNTGTTFWTYLSKVI